MKILLKKYLHLIQSLLRLKIKYLILLGWLKGLITPNITGFVSKTNFHKELTEIENKIPNVADFKIRTKISVTVSKILGTKGDI